MTYAVPSRNRRQAKSMTKASFLASGEQVARRRWWNQADDTTVRSRKAAGDAGEGPATKKRGQAFLHSYLQSETRFTRQAREIAVTLGDDVALESRLGEPTLSSAKAAGKNWPHRRDGPAVDFKQYVTRANRGGRMGQKAVKGQVPRSEALGKLASLGCSMQERRPGMAAHLEAQRCENILEASPWWTALVT